MEKICPIMGAKHKCLGKRCALWDSDEERCALNSIAYNLWRIAEKLEEK